MGHRGERSDPAKLRRTVKHVILEAAFKDQHKKEAISQTDVEDIIKKVLVAHPELSVFESLIRFEFSEIIRGLVLTDSYGRGIFNMPDSFWCMQIEVSLRDSDSEELRGGD
jgi:hypothetical protein